MAAKRLFSMAPKQFILILTFTVTALAQSRPASTAPEELAKLTSDAEKVIARLGGLKGIEERIAVLERKILEAKQTVQPSGLPSPLNARASRLPEPAEVVTIAMKKPMIEDEEPFDPAKLFAAEAADAAEAAVRAENAAATARAAATLAAARAAEATAKTRGAAALPAAPAIPAQASPASNVGFVSPEVKRRVAPELTSALRNSLEEEVTVSLDVEVAANGEVTGVSPQEKGTVLIDQLNVAAIVAVRQWQFEAGTQDGKAVACRTTVRFKFTK